MLQTKRTSLPLQQQLCVFICLYLSGVSGSWATEYDKSLGLLPVQCAARHLTLCSVQLETKVTEVFKITEKACNNLNQQFMGVTNSMHSRRFQLGEGLNRGLHPFSVIVKPQTSRWFVSSSSAQTSREFGWREAFKQHASSSLYLDINWGSLGAWWVSLLPAKFTCFPLFQLPRTLGV